MELSPYLSQVLYSLLISPLPWANFYIQTDLPNYFFPTQHRHTSCSSKFNKYQNISPAQFALQTSSCPLYPSPASSIVFVPAPVAAQNPAPITPASGHHLSCPGHTSGLVLSSLPLRGNLGCSVCLVLPHTQLLLSGTTAPHSVLSLPCFWKRLP